MIKITLTNQVSGRTKELSVESIHFDVDMKEFLLDFGNGKGMDSIILTDSQMLKMGRDEFFNFMSIVYEK